MCQASACLLHRSPGGSRAPAYRASALLSGIQGSSQAVCRLGGFIFYPEIQRPPRPLHAALAVLGGQLM